MPKIEVNADGGFLLNGYPKKSAYDVNHTGDSLDPFITLYELGTNRLPIAQAPLSEWTDVNDAGFATLNDFYTYLSSVVGFFLSASGGGGGATWGSITGDINTQTDLPFTVENTTDARFKGDVYASGEFFAQQNSTIYANNIKVGVTGNKLVVTDQGNNKQSLIARNEVDSGDSTGTKDVFRYSSFTKNDPLGQQQPDDSLTFNAFSFVEELTGKTKYYQQLTLQSLKTLVTDTWYLRSLTGFVNAYIYVYKGAVNFASLPGNQSEKYWTTNTDKEIINETNLVNDAGGAGIDITFPLGNTFFEEVNDVYTYVFIADNDFTLQGQNFGPGLDIAYILGDGARWGVVNTSSKVVINGNLSPNEFNGTLQINSNSTEYYGCSVNLDAGIYNKIDIPYKNGVLTTGNGNIYVIILDQDDNTLLYKKELIPSLSAEGTLVINFDEDLLLETSGIYQVVIGRRNWNSSSRRIELFHKDVNSSDGSVWVAYSSSNPALDVGDTSGVDWSTIQKQNFNRIPKALIYKF